MKKYLIWFSSLLTFICAFAQKEANVWHFGIGNSLDFNSGSPVQTSGSQMYTNEGCTYFCDENGIMYNWTWVCAFNQVSFKVNDFQTFHKPVRKQLS